LLDPAHVLVLALIMIVLWLLRGISFHHLAVAAAAILLVIGPWIIRNNIEIGYPTFIRSNIGFEVYRGLLFGPWESQQASNLNPGRNPAQLSVYKELGEYRYMAEQSRLARELFVTDPSLVLRRAAARFAAFW